MQRTELQTTIILHYHVNDDETVMQLIRDFLKVLCDEGLIDPQYDNIIAAASLRE